MVAAKAKRSCRCPSDSAERQVRAMGPPMCVGSRGCRQLAAHEPEVLESSNLLTILFLFRHLGIAVRPPGHVDGACGARAGQWARPSGYGGRPSRRGTGSQVLLSAHQSAKGPLVRSPFRPRILVEREPTDHKANRRHRRGRAPGVGGRLAMLSASNGPRDRRHALLATLERRQAKLIADVAIDGWARHERTIRGFLRLLNTRVASGSAGR